jgi:2-hydroxy-3-keto-5-methylthiopentenyl-1-phosphate phosphatase
MAEFRQSRSHTEVRLAFIGDGYSDICAVTQADLLIAKKDLALYCSERGIAYTPFDNFTEVAQILVDHGYLLRDD